MGWSCTQRASRVAEAWQAGCVEQTGSQNTFESKGARYFYEVSRKDQPDGGICGSIFKFTDADHARLSGSFRIDGNGIIVRAPKTLKEFAEEFKRE